MSKGIIIRTDASVEIGTGHFMRCLSLANELNKRGIDTLFASAECPESLIERVQNFVQIKAKPGSLEDSEEVSALAKKHNISNIITDGYHFKDEYQTIIKKNDLHLLFIDDFGHCQQYSADIILNQNCYASAKLYPGIGVFTRLLLGAKYILLRDEFEKYINFNRSFDQEAKKILITFGGSDPFNATAKVLNAIINNSKFMIKVVIGGANPNCLELEKKFAGYSNIQFLKDLKNVSEHMKWAEIAFTSGGTTSWEIAFMGLPQLIIYCAENQKPVAECLAESGAAINLGHCSNIAEEEIERQLLLVVKNKKLLKSISENAKKIIDGKGSERVADELISPYLRLARKEDCKFVWELSNDKDVRKVSFTQNLIPWEEHQKWYHAKLNDKNYFFLIAESFECEPIAQIRFSITNSEAIISISIKKDFRGKGYASKLISIASENLFRAKNVKIIKAYIKPDNTSSIRAFNKAGYVMANPDKFASQNNSLLFILERQS